MCHLPTCSYNSAVTVIVQNEWIRSEYKNSCSLVTELFCYKNRVYESRMRRFRKQYEGDCFSAFFSDIQIIFKKQHASSTNLLKRHKIRIKHSNRLFVC